MHFLETVEKNKENFTKKIKITKSYLLNKTT